MLYEVITGLAVLAEVTFVIVILQVAGDAGHVEFVGKRVLAVAVVAGLLGMLAVEFEIGVAIVVEAGRITSYNVCYTKLLRAGNRLAYAGY